MQDVIIPVLLHAGSLFSPWLEVILHFLNDISNRSPITFSSSIFQYFQGISDIFSGVFKFQHIFVWYYNVPEFEYCCPEFCIQRTEISTVHNSPMYIPRGTPRVTWLLSLEQSRAPVAQLHIFFMFGFTFLILAQKVLTLILDPSVTLGFRLFFLEGGGRKSSQWARASSFTKFLVHTQRRTTVGRTSLDERSARRRHFYLTTHNTHNRQTSMPPVGFELIISAARETADLSLRPRGHRDRQIKFIIPLNTFMIIQSAVADMQGLTINFHTPHNHPRNLGMFIS